MPGLGVPIFTHVKIMSFLQRPFTKLLPRKWAEDIEAHSRSWMVSGPKCGYGASERRKTMLPIITTSIRKRQRPVYISRSRGVRLSATLLALVVVLTVGLAGVARMASPSAFAA